MASASAWAERGAAAARPAARRAKVLHLTAVDDSVRFLLDDQLQWLVTSGYEVHAAASPGRHVDYIRQELGIPFHPVRMYRRISPPGDARSLWDLVALFRRERFDLVHTHTLKPMLLGALAARLTGVPIVVNTLRPYLQEHQPARTRRLLAGIDRLMASLSTHVLAQNPDDVERYRRLGICPAHKISALGNGIDLDRFAPGRVTAGERSAFRRGHGIPDDGLVVGMAGRYVKEKGYEEFFDAVARLASRNSRLYFLTAGSALPSGRGGLPEDLAFRQGLDGRGARLEHRDDLRVIYASMDVLLFPSHRESFPRVPMEAAAMGLPAVITATSGGRACVRHGENGFVVPVGDVEGMVECTQRLLDDGPRRAAMGLAARRMAEREFDQRRVFRRVVDCYGRLFARSGQGELVRCMR